MIVVLLIILLVMTFTMLELLMIIMKSFGTIILLAMSSLQVKYN